MRAMWCAVHTSRRFQGNRYCLQAKLLEKSLWFFLQRERKYIIPAIHVAYTRLKRRKKIETNLFHPQRFHCCSNLSRSSNGRFRNRKCLGTYGIWILHLLSQNQKFVHILWEICPFLHWSKFRPLTIASENAIVLISLTLFPRCCMKNKLP